MGSLTWEIPCFMATCGIALMLAAYIATYW
jgi:hypothetical protein